jgi:ubiquinone biosynthesis accessory factor UbiK
MLIFWVSILRGDLNACCLAIEQDACQLENIDSYQMVANYHLSCLCQRSAMKSRTCTTLGSKCGFFCDHAYLSLVFSQWLRYQSHMGDDSIENLARKLAESVPDGMRSIASDLETNFRGVLRSGLNKLDLVTREEFEVQEAVLARTRKKLERLETKLQELEKNL